MAYDTYEEFSDTMSDILSSGGAFEMENWHVQSIAKLIEGMDRDSVVNYANIFYSDQDPAELREGELADVAELISKLEPSRPEVGVDFQIVFK